jgi:hypothetical protein
MQAEGAGKKGKWSDLLPGGHHCHIVDKTDLGDLTYRLLMFALNRTSSSRSVMVAKVHSNAIVRTYDIADEQ